ncbi:hypothetical protein C8Q75DRAFT_268098 [Abortiporus biennis]|nr:hypothetical protein C8Q75DRAFT_268098 [Abortiporus biennis]
MAKSTRSKVKRHFRAKKRTDSIYAAVDAARLNRLSRKLKSITTTDVVDEDEEEEVEEDGENVTMRDTDAPVDLAANDDTMALDGEQTQGDSSSTKISTHGPRNSRREQWRASKGMTPRLQSKGMNRQGGIAAKRKAGRSHRRR